MSFIKNIQVWNNHIPRVCNFDFEDYTNSGWVGNNCRSAIFDNPEDNYNNLCIEDPSTTARATRNAYVKALDELFDSIYEFYFNQENTTYGIARSENNICITPAKRQAFLDAYWGPTGLKQKLWDVLYIKQPQLFNAMTPACSSEKRNGIQNLTEFWRNAYDETRISVTYQVDFTNYQSMNYYILDEYQLAFKNLVQDVKNTLIKLTNAPLTISQNKTCSDDVTIGSQIWTRCNLGITTYRNGDVIPQVTDPTQWSNLTTGAWCYYDNDPSTEAKYGKLYNWYAVNDLRGIAPTGYHVPSDAEWTVLTDYLGGESVAGGKMKKAGTAYWNAPNTDATNSSGFTGLPGGYRNDDGSFYSIGFYGYWWSSTEVNTNDAWFRYLDGTNGDAFRSYYSKEDGLSVRLIKD